MRPFHSAVTCFLVSKWKFFVILLSVLAQFFVQLFVFSSQNIVNLFLFFSPISASFLVQLCVFDLQKVLNLFKFFYQFKPRSLCSNIFFSLKMFWMFSYLFPNFSLALSASISFLASKYSKLVLILLWVWGSFLGELFGLYSQNVLNLFLHFYQFQPCYLCSYLYFSLKIF